MVERASPFANPVDGNRAGITLSAPARGSIWQIACWATNFAEVEALIASTLGCNAPVPGRVAVASQDRLVTRVEPLKWWVIGQDGADCPVALPPEQGAVLDMSHDQVSILIQGSHAPEFLKRFLSLDLRDAAFPDMSFATTELHHMITRIMRRDAGDVRGYEMMVMRSYADMLHELLQDHLDQFGAPA